MIIEAQPKPDWAVLPRPGCENVEFRVLLGKDKLSVANLRFAESATIDKHSAPFEIDVLCMAGSGFTSLDDDVAPISAGESIRWPAGKQHCLWTETTTMETIMIERHDTISS